MMVAWFATSPITRAQAGGPINLTAPDTAYEQDFDTLALSGTSSVLPAGWAFAESGTNGNTTYTAGTGSGNAGETYSFGATASVERAFGGLQSGTLIPTIGAAFINNTGSTITSLDIAYRGEQWRLGTALGTGGRTEADRLNFQYSGDASSLTTGTWIDVDSLDFVAPITGGPLGPLDGNGSTNGVDVSGTIGSLSVASGATVWIRWTDLNVGGDADGLAVDDFSITPHGGGPTARTTNNGSIDEANSGTTSATSVVSVSSSAHEGGTFDTATVDGTGPSAATVVDGDYVARSESGVLIPAGETTYTFAVVINGD